MTPVPVVDELGDPVPLSGPPTAVVSIVPSLTESIARTVPGVLVGATDYCVHPAGLPVARVGGSKYPKLERILALRPGLVVANVEENRPEDVAALRAAGVPVWVSAAPDSVPAALASLRRLFAEVFAVPTPDWLAAADEAWRTVGPVRATVVVPVWRRPWVVLGRDTFAGDVLRRLGFGNAFADAAQRYPRPDLDELHVLFASGRATGLVLPDEPYRFTAEDGPDAFPTVRYVLISGRYLTWWGPSLVDARPILAAGLADLE
ncbi:MAG TPA: helical backbone metal receptor [Pseudonocardiaceae bacterium]|nr:helical backbone metal receptor [Pseudonocardiaceae bacterium]